ncbi:phage portal protein, partial [Thioclava sp. BHET1]
SIGYGRSRVRSLPPVSPLTAQKHATVYACCNVIAGDLAKVPLHVYQRGKNGKDQRVESHPADYLLNVESSPGVGAMIARFALIYAFCLRGRSYAWAPRDGAGELTLIDVIRPDLCTELVNGRQHFYDFPDGALIYR